MMDRGIADYPPVRLAFWRELAVAMLAQAQAITKTGM
jgi:hypothetical protein